MIEKLVVLSLEINWSLLIRKLADIITNLYEIYKSEK